MDSSGKFWIIINAIVFSALVAITGISVDYWKDHNKKIVELISAGVDPVAAMCAMQDDYGRMPVCLVIAAKQEKQP